VGILQRLAEVRASPENPSTNLADPAAWLVDSLVSGQESRAGKRISETTALYNTALSACVRLLSETVATLPLHVYRVNGRTREIDTEHPVARLLRRPNYEMDAVQLRETLMAHVLTWGNAYAEIERNGAGRPVALWPLLPDRTRPQRTDRGTLFYTTSVGTRNFNLPAENVFHLVGLGFDGLMGYSPIRMHRQAIGLALATEEFGASWFGSGSRPSGVLTHPGALSDKAKANLRRGWESAHAGLSNSNRVAILEEGLKWQQIGIPPEDAQFLETRKFQVEEIARMYRVPLHLIQHMEKSTSWGSGIEELGQGFVTYSLQSWLVRWEQRIQSRLIPAVEDGRVYAKHSVEGLLRGDSVKRAEFYSKMVAMGVYSINEIRELEDRNPIDDGDLRFVPLNWQTLDGANAEPQPAPAAQLAEREARDISHATSKLDAENRTIERRNARKETFRPLFRAAARKVVAWEAARLKAAIKRGKDANNADSVGDWVGDQAEATKSYAKRQFDPVVKAYGADNLNQTAEEEGAPPPLKAEQYREFVDEYSNGLATRYTNESIAQVRGRIAQAPDAESAFDALDELLDYWEEDRSDSFADEELTQAGGAFIKAALFAAGVQFLRWRANAGACPLCESLDGAVTEITTPFVEAGSIVDAGEGVTPLNVSFNIGHPPLHVGCECQIVKD
jgi:HK97 family phage portal protein